jgi:3-hydroxymyristoyl/3-hydroxydecanoyl-(acyl carrier protein) dehydratase
MIATREFALPADHPVLPGHFPGHPVVPGILLLSWCELLAAELACAPVMMCAWINVKFVRPLSPAQTCRITLISATPGNAKFRIERGGQLIASGILKWQLAMT